MEKLRPHHVVCLTKLYNALSLFAKNDKLYYNAIKAELVFSTNLREDQLDCCKITWGTIYSGDVMKVLVKILDDGEFITSNNSCDSICSACYGNTDGKCVGEDNIQLMDYLASQILNIKTDTVTSVHSLQDNIALNKICDICGTKDKCNLIRRATQFYKG